MKFTKTDIIPTEFALVARYDLGNKKSDPFNVTVAAMLMDSHPVENFVDLGKCCVCGTRFRHGEVWRHTPSGVYLCLGQSCAHKYGLVQADDHYALDHSAHLVKMELRNKRREIRAEMKEFLRPRAEVRKAMYLDDNIARSLRASLIRWGHLTDKQVTLAEQLAVEQDPIVELVDSLCDLIDSRRDDDGCTIAIQDRLAELLRKALR
jgi:hypothetical protein